MAAAAPARTLAWRLRQAWRVLATGLSFTVFGVACVAFGFTLFPLACLTAPSRAASRRRAQWIVHRWFGLFAGLMKSLGLLTVEITGAERLRQPGHLIVANHPSLIDVVLLIAHIPEVDCIVKRQIFRNPLMRWPVVWAGYISNSSPAQLIEDCAATLRNGHSLLVFPEGTRTVPGQPLRMTHGAARIALEADATVLPVTIECSEQLLFKGLPWYRVPPATPHYRLTVGEPYPARRFLTEAGGQITVAARWLTHHWERQFAAATGNRAAHPLADAAAHAQYSSSLP